MSKNSVSEPKSRLRGFHVYDILWADFVASIKTRAKATQTTHLSITSVLTDFIRQHIKQWPPEKEENNSIE